MSFWKQRHVFVTGATGLLGSWLIEELLERGADVVCLVRDWVPRSRAAEEGLLQRVNVVHGELEDYERVVRTINEYEVGTVFHLGAQTIVGTASRCPRSTFEANIRGTWNLLEACRECPSLIEHVIVASSDKAYGVHAELPYTEDTPLQGRYPYDVSKSCADLISLGYYHTYRTPLAITRCGNLFGGGDLNFNRLIPGTIRSVFRDERPIIRSDGRFLRDYFYVKDAVNAYLMLAENLAKGPFLGESFNFGNETPTSVLDVVHLILRLLQKESLTPKILNQARHEIPQQYLNCAKAHRLLGWKPCYTLEEGLRETITWYRNWLGGVRDTSGGIELSDQRLRDSYKTETRP